MRPKRFKLWRGKQESEVYFSLHKGSGGDSKPYLWVGTDGTCHGWIEGAALRDLGERIVAAVPRRGGER